MRLLLLRHAQTIENAEERFQGHIHGRRSPLGIRQTVLLAKALKNESIDFFFGSPLGRARETLQAVRKNHPHIRAIFDDSLMERGKGVWEEWLIADAVRKDPKLMVKMSQRNYRPENGESLEDVSSRVKPFLSRLEKIGNGKTALVVGHGILNSELLRLILRTNSRFVQYNACINEIWLLKNGPRVVRLNDVRHLGKWVS